MIAAPSLFLLTLVLRPSRIQSETFTAVPPTALPCRGAETSLITPPYCSFDSNRSFPV